MNTRETKFMKVRDLLQIIKDLKAKKEINNDTIIVLSCDAEGNSFGIPSNEEYASIGMNFELTYDEKEISKNNLVIYPSYEGLE